MKRFVDIIVVLRYKCLKARFYDNFINSSVVLRNLQFLLFLCAARERTAKIPRAAPTEPSGWSLACRNAVQMSVAGQWGVAFRRCSLARARSRMRLMLPEFSEIQRMDGKATEEGRSVLIPYNPIGSRGRLWLIVFLS